MIGKCHFDSVSFLLIGAYQLGADNIENSLWKGNIYAIYFAPDQHDTLRRQMRS